MSDKLRTGGRYDESKWLHNMWLYGESERRRLIREGGLDPDNLSPSMKRILCQEITTTRVELGEWIKAVMDFMGGKACCPVCGKEGGK